MPPVQLLEIVIFALLAAVLLYNLYAVLGRRIGRQPGEEAQPAPAGAPGDRRAPAVPAAGGEVELTGLPAIAARDPAFEVDKFLQGGKGAYQMIVKAFSTGDRETLKGLVSAHVLAGFERAMAQRETEGRTESIEFEHAPRADIEETTVEGDTARIRVRFLGEFTSRTTGPDGEHDGERRTAESWTFERNLSSRDPNWTLVRVDAAEA